MKRRFWKEHKMSEQKYFKNALKNFIFDVAGGGAICHLADSGYTAEQIRKRLDFPTPFDKVQQTVWDHFLETGYLLYREPGQGEQQEKFSYVVDYDQYGRSSFRRIAVSEGGAKEIRWKEEDFRADVHGTLSSYLTEKCRGNGETSAYVSCDFGLRSRREPERFLEELQVLDEYQREYVLGMPWERRMIYHRLDQRMRGIVSRMYEHGVYHGVCYFMELEEKIRI